MAVDVSDGEGGWIVVRIAVAMIVVRPCAGVANKTSQPRATPIQNFCLHLLPLPVQFISSHLPSLPPLPHPHPLHEGLFDFG